MVPNGGDTYGLQTAEDYEWIPPVWKYIFGTGPGTSDGDIHDIPVDLSDMVPTPSVSPYPCMNGRVSGDISAYGPIKTNSIAPNDSVLNRINTEIAERVKTPFSRTFSSGGCGSNGKCCPIVTIDTNLRVKVRIRGLINLGSIGSGWRKINLGKLDVTFNIAMTLRTHIEVGICMGNFCKCPRPLPPLNSNINIDSTGTVIDVGEH